MKTRIVQTALHTEYAGTGRVRALSFFGGAGCCIPLVRGKGRDGKPLDAWHWPNLSLPGFTLYLRTAATSCLFRPSNSLRLKTFKHIAIVVNPNRWSLFA